jgi:hypothetical protein
METIGQVVASHSSGSGDFYGSLAETIILPNPELQAAAPASQTSKSGPITTTGELPGRPGSPGTATNLPTSVDVELTESGNTQVPGQAGKPGRTALPGQAGSSGAAGNAGYSGTPGQSGASGVSGVAKTAQSYDPNAKIGPVGVGTLNYVSGSALTLFPYQIDFENSPTATAPAQQVTITDPLDTNLDLSTFQLTAIAFGDVVIAVPAGSQQFQTTVPVTDNGQTFDVVISAGLDYATGEVYARFESIDPTTQLPPDVLTGFLPPENGTGRGEGYISFIISPKADVPNDTQIRNVAIITFDSNAPITTDQISDTDPSEGIDPTKEDLITLITAPPTSNVSPLPATENTSSFAVSWSGQDPDGPGIASYSVWVSIDDGPYLEWLSNTSALSAPYKAEAGSHTYEFYSVATDDVRNVQSTPTADQATTSDDVLPPPQPGPPALVPADDSGTKGDDITDDSALAFSGTTQAGATVQLLSGATVLGTATAGASGGYLIPAQSPLGPGRYEITVVASNAGGASVASNPLTLTIVTPPATPGVPTLPADEIVGAQTTLSTSPELIGSTIPGATVQLLGPGGAVLQTGQANGSGAYEIQVPGPLSVGAHTYQVDVIDSDGDVSAPSAIVTITVMAPLVTVESVMVEKIKVGNGKKAKKVTVLVLQFSGALDPGAASNARAYELAPVLTVKAKGKGKNKKPATQKLGSPVNPASASFTSSDDQVTLVPRGTLNLTKPEELIVNASLVTDALGREIDGGDVGEQGGDYIATVSGTRVTVGGLPLVKLKAEEAAHHIQATARASRASAPRLPSLNLAGGKGGKTSMEGGTLGTPTKDRQQANSRGTVSRDSAATIDPASEVMAASSFDLATAIVTAESDSNTSDTINVPTGVYTI